MEDRWVLVINFYFCVVYLFGLICSFFRFLKFLYHLTDFPHPIVVQTRFLARPVRPSPGQRLRPAESAAVAVTVDGRQLPCAEPAYSGADEGIWI